MAHYAELDSNNVVKQVIVVSNADTSTAQGEEKESIGIAFCERLLGGNWKQTSYNTQGGTHTNGGTPFRGNYAGIGYTYDPTNDVFYAPQPYPSWTISAPTWTWTSPVPYPTDVGTEESPKRYNWDENNRTWVEVTQ